MEKDYIRSILKLYEATPPGMAGTPEVIPQEQIADSGMDVNQGMIPQDGSGMDQTQMAPDGNMDPNMMEGDPSMEGGDLSMMGEDPMMEDPMAGQEAPPEDTGHDKRIAQRNKKVFELTEELLSYIDNFMGVLESIDTNLLPTLKSERLQRYIKNITELKDKIKNYLINIFNTDEYEARMYAYILFRTELITNVKGLYSLLKLDSDAEI